MHLLTVFLSAFLLFLVQSILGKHLLPWFGGTPSVWAACMLFFQTVLLAGYAYVWALDRWLSPRGQRAVHLFVLAAGGASLTWLWLGMGSALLPPESWKPRGGENPVGMILVVLGACVGMPFFALSATAPLVQRWWSAALSPRGPWRLYALSNAGSLLGLLSFPFWLEPHWPLPQLAGGWTLLFGIFALTCAWCAFRAGRISGTEARPAPVTESGAMRNWWLWLLLATVTSALFLATTNQLCQEVALVPMLWVLPLAVYLITFILCFDSPRWYSRRWMTMAAVPATLATLVCAWFGVALSIPVQIIAHGVLLFLVCMACHGELARLKPAPQHLAAYFLVIALGGALGGAAISLGAPVMLKRVSEFHIALLGAWIALAVVFVRDRQSFFFTGDRLMFYLTLLVLSGAALVSAGILLPWTVPPWLRLWGAPLACALGITLIAASLLRRRTLPGHRWWPRLLVASVVFGVELFMLDRMRVTAGGEVAAARNFFGAVRVRKYAPIKELAIVQLTHGQINHGFQYLDETLYRQPAGYCSPDSGAGLALTKHPRREGAAGGTAAAPMRVGVAGLGVGAMAAYGRTGDVFRFYEINPVVIEYAAGPRPYFTYCQDTPATVETVEGDARISLERELREQGGQQFDVLLLDAFSSDSVPVHLLTIEAMEMYVRHLRDSDSLIAVNISNRFIDFRPLLYALSRRLEMQMRIYYHPGNPPVPTASMWVLLGARGHSLLKIPGMDDEKFAVPDKEVLWTDAHSDVFSLIHWTQERRRHYVLVTPR